MPFYNEPRLIESAPLTLDDTDVSFWDYMRASAGDAWNDNPATALKRTGDIYIAQVGEDTVADLAMQNGLSIDLDQVEFTGSPALSLDEQTRIIKDSGLEGHVKAQEGYNAEALNIVMQDKQDEIDRALTREQAPAWMAPFGFAAGLGVSFLDPINIASSFVPVLGEQRVMRMLANASGAGGRAAVRAGVGAVEGAVGAAMVEPVLYLAKNQQQADYGMTDSLLNIAFGAVMGGAMHSAAGAWGDWVRNRRGERHPWEIVSPTDQTELLRKGFADDLFSAAEQAGASITREQADLTSALFDVRARTWAYDEGLSVQDYYDRYKTRFTSGTGEGSSVGGDSLEQFLGAQGISRMGLADEVTIRMDNLAVARSMDRAGRDARVIKEATGWERGADGKWRYEVGDVILSDEWLNRNLKVDDSGTGSFTGTMANVVPADLLTAYPALKDVPVTIRISPSSGRAGAYSSDGIEISAPSSRDVNSLLNHEIQHAIQEQEGFARGGSPAEMRDMAIAQVQERLASLERGDDIRMLMEMEDGTFFDEVPADLRPIFQEKLEELRQTITPEEVAQYRELAAGMDYESVSEAAFDLYRQLMGEVEARNVQTRMGMTMEERLASLASETEDVTREDQIFLENTVRAAMAEEAPSGPKAAVTFDAAEDAKAIISFFQSADVTSAPHEIYHIFRRELAETAMAEGASEKSRQMWRQACEFVGADPGQAWTREMEEKFAMAGERFLTEGVAPRPDLQGLFEKMRQWFLEIYTAVESAGVELSDGMRKTFGDMLALSPEESDAAFRYGLGRLIEQSPVEGMDTSVQQPLDEKAAPAEVLAALQDDSVARLNEAISYTSKLPPEDMQALTDNFNAEMAAIDAVISNEEARAQIMREAALCDLRR